MELLLLQTWRSNFTPSIIGQLLFCLQDFPPPYSLFLHLERPSLFVSWGRTSCPHRLVVSARNKQRGGEPRGRLWSCCLSSILPQCRTDAMALHLRCRLAVRPPVWLLSTRVEPGGADRSNLKIFQQFAQGCQRRYLYRPSSWLPRYTDPRARCQDRPPHWSNSWEESTYWDSNRQFLHRSRSLCPGKSR